MNPSAIIEIKNIKFPLDDNYDWRLACRQCFVKIGEGIRGFQYRGNLPHECTRHILLVKVRREGMNWIKVRPRPESKFQQFGSYKICTHFSSGNPCAVGEEKCTFAHNTAEKTLWNMDRIGSFLLLEFISKLQQYKIGQNTCKMFCCYLCKFYNTVRLMNILLLMRLYWWRSVKVCPEVWKIVFIWILIIYTFHPWIYWYIIYIIKIMCKCWDDEQ